MSCAAPTSTPQVGCATTMIFGASRTSRPTMNFRRLPPERLGAIDSSLPHFDLEGLDHVRANAREALCRMIPWLSTSLRAPVSSALSASDSAGTRAPAQPFLRTRT